MGDSNLLGICEAKTLRRGDAEGARLRNPVPAMKKHPLYGGAFFIEGRDWVLRCVCEADARRRFANGAQKCEAFRSGVASEAQSCPR